MFRIKGSPPLAAESGTRGERWEEGEWGGVTPKTRSERRQVKASFHKGVTKKKEKI